MTQLPNDRCCNRLAVALDPVAVPSNPLRAGHGLVTYVSPLVDSTLGVSPGADGAVGSLSKDRTIGGCQCRFAADKLLGIVHTRHGRKRRPVRKRVFSLGLVILERLPANRAVGGGPVVEVLKEIRSFDGDKLASTVKEPFRSSLGAVLCLDA